MENGSNNGSLYLSVRDATDRIGLADHTATQRAFDELERMGFIECTSDAHFSVKASEKSRARTWRLTHLPGPGRRGPSNEFRDRQPDSGSREFKRMERGLGAIKRYKRAVSYGRYPMLDSDTNG